MNNYKATLKKSGFPDSKFDILRNKLEDASLYAEQVGIKFDCDEVHVQNIEINHPEREYIIKTKLK